MPSAKKLAANEERYVLRYPEVRRWRRSVVRPTMPSILGTDENLLVLGPDYTVDGRKLP